jgi:HSP20 family protein
MICNIISNREKRGDVGVFCIGPDMKSAFASAGMAPLLHRIQIRTQESEWGPNVDIGETPEEIFVVAEFTGVKKEDIKVTKEDDIITISGNKKKEKEGESASGGLEEINHGNFSRSFMLPENVDKEKIKAEFKDGILKIRMPKKEKVSKTVEVN